MDVRSRNAAALTLTLLALYLPLSAGPVAAAPVELRQLIDKLLSDPCLDHGVQGVVIRSLDTGETLYERGADLALIPASNMKLLVSAAALARLGPDYTCATHVLTDGTIDANGTLDGDLILKGGGDSTLDTEGLRELARRVRSAGITKVKGAVVADDTAFDGQRLGWGWSWDNEPYYYSAQVSALCLNRNTIDVWVYPGRSAGSPAVIRTVPPTNLVSVESTATTGRADSEKTIRAGRKRGLNVIQVSGSVPEGDDPGQREAPITVEDPALYAGDVFRTELARQGVRVVGGLRSGAAPEGAAQIAEHTSPPLSRVLSLLNKPSDNLIAEVLLKSLGLAAKGRGTTEAGAEAAMEVFAQAGMDTGAIRMVDGSGLSRLNLVTARNVAALLGYMRAHPQAEVFVSSLPTAGVDGTLRGRMRGTPAEGRVHAKTGYVSRVSSLSGYVDTRSGERLVFAMLMNNHLCQNVEARAVQDRICALLAGLP